MNPAADGSVPELQEAGAGRFRLSGPVTLSTVGALRSAGLRAFGAATGAVDLDLSGVTRADSGALALLIDWLAWSRRAGRPMHVASIPAALLALARLSDVEEFLTGAPAAAASGAG